jgi:hypothetical protein
MVLGESTEGLLPEPRCRHAHGYGSFTHSVKGVSARFRGRALFDEISQDGCSGKHGKVDIVKRLERLATFRGSWVTKRCPRRRVLTNNDRTATECQTAYRKEMPKLVSWTSFCCA